MNFEERTMCAYIYKDMYVHIFLCVCVCVCARAHALAYPTKKGQKVKRKTLRAKT
jgi:hypothetical protein